jgi:hypothetical protein
MQLAGIYASVNYVYNDADHIPSYTFESSTYMMHTVQSESHLADQDE